MNLLDILDRLKVYLYNLRRKLWRIVLVMLLVAAVFLLHGLSKPPFYTATALFHPAQEKTTASLETGLTQFFGLPGQEGSELTYMKGLLNSRSLNQSLVGDTVLFEGEKHLMADLIFKHQPAYTSLFSRLKQMILPSDDPRNLPLNRKLVLAAGVAKNSMQITTNDNGFAQLEVSFYNPEVTALICEQYLTFLRRYYAEQKVRKGRQTLQFLTKRADSIKQELDRLNYRLAEAKEKGRFAIRYRDDIGPAEMESEQALLSQMYVSLYVNQEQTRAQLQRDLSPIQVVDPPMPPYDVTRANLPIYVVLGLVLGGGMAAFLFSFPLLKADVEMAIRTFVLEPALTQRQAQEEDFLSQEEDEEQANTPREP